MPRTPEKIAADNALEEAIRNALVAYKRECPGILLSYVVVTEHAEYKDDGEISDEYFNIITNPMERLSTSKGLLTIGLEEIESEGAESDDD